MKNVTVSEPKNDSLVAQIASLYKTLKNINRDESVSFNLCELKWTCPLLILPISAYINTTSSQAKMEGCEIYSYLYNIDFPRGVDSVSKLKQIIQSQKSYIPISVLRREADEEREKLESMFATIIYKAMDKTPSGTSNAIYQPISELVTNIFEHSEQNIGYIFGQLYPSKNYLDICIVDRGRGLQRTYLEEKKLELTDAESILEVMRGNSVKPGNERGYGVRTSRNLVCDGLGGDFVILSGSAALISKKDYNRIVALNGFYWQGVIIAYRIPKPEKPIDISSYLE